MGLTNNLGKLSNMITSTGSAVGIGTSSINWNYSLLTPLQIRNASIYAYSDYELGIQTNSYYDSSWRYQGTNTNTLFQISLGTSNAIKFNYATYGTAGTSFTWNEAMRITSTGVVGIGTSSPSYTLDVTGTGRFTSSLIAASFSTPSTGLSGSTTWNFYHDQYAAGDFGLWAGSTNRILINASGNIGIGTTSPPNYSGYTVLALNNATNGGVIDFQTNGTRTATINNDTASFNIGTITSYPFLFYTSGLERMRITSAGNVGIGTGNPSDKLNVIVTSNGNNARFDGPTSGLILQTNASSADIIAYGGITPAYRALNFSTSASTNMTITTGGNVGIGTTSPSYPLDVQFGGNISQRIRNNSAGGTATLLLETANTFSGTSQAYVQCIGTAGGGQSQLVFATAGASGDSTATERMRITSGGNVGIGTTSPTAQLSIANQISNGANPVSSYAATSGVNGQNFFNGYYSSNSDALGPYPRWLDIVSVGSPDGSNGGSNIRFFTNPVATSSPAVERMRISSNGNVGIGLGPNSTINASLVIGKDQTYPGDVNPASLMLCGLSDTNKRMSMGYDTTSNYAWIVAGQYGVQWTSLYLQRSGGAVYAGTARIDNNSDIRVKDNIQPLTGALNKVLGMNGKKFHMLDEPEDKIRLGFIAQELEGIVDELVIHSDRNQKLPNGDIVENVLGLETWGSSWAALLVEAIKEQQQQIEELKQLINK